MEADRNRTEDRRGPSRRPYPRERRKAHGPGDYNARYDGYQREHNALRGKLEKLSEKKEKRRQQIDVLDRFIADLKEMRDMPVEFSGSLWNAFVEKLTIRQDGRAEFLFRNGAVITEEL